LAKIYSYQLDQKLLILSWLELSIGTTNINILHLAPYQEQARAKVDNNADTIRNLFGEIHDMLAVDILNVLQFKICQRLRTQYYLIVIIILPEIMLTTIHIYQLKVAQIVQKIGKTVKMVYVLVAQALHGIHIVVNTALLQHAQML